MSVSEAKKAANHRYDKATYEGIYIRVRKGGKAKIKAAAERDNKSVNRFILDAVEEKIEKLN